MIRAELPAIRMFMVWKSGSKASLIKDKSGPEVWEGLSLYPGPGVSSRPGWARIRTGPYSHWLHPVCRWQMYQTRPRRPWTSLSQKWSVWYWRESLEKRDSTGAVTLSCRRTPLLFWKIQQWKRGPSLNACCLFFFFSIFPAISWEWRMCRKCVCVCVCVCAHMCTYLLAHASCWPTSNTLLVVRWPRGSGSHGGWGNSRDRHPRETQKMCELSISHCSFNADALLGDNETGGQEYCVFSSCNFLGQQGAIQPCENSSHQVRATWPRCQMLPGPQGCLFTASFTIWEWAYVCLQS